MNPCKKNKIGLIPRSFSKSTFQCFGLVISLPHKKPKIITIEGTINNKNIPWIRALDPKPSSI